MHTLEHFALNSGLKAKQPYIMDKIYPTLLDKFITVYPYAAISSRCYSYWNEVCRILHPVLSKNGIAMAQMGGADTPSINGCVNLSGQLNYNQCNYLIRHAMLHLCVDSFTTQFASSQKKKMVCIYGDRPPQNNKPFWSNNKDVICLGHNNQDRLYSYSDTEENKNIDSIRPEVIAKSVCSLLGIDLHYPYRTLYIGKEYPQRCIESVPANNPIDISNMHIDSLIVRMDLFFSEQALINQLSVTDCSIITSKAIDLKVISHFRSKIREFIYLIDGVNDSKDYVESLYKMGVKCHLMTEKSGEELNNLKLKYIDYGPIHMRPKSSKEDYDFLKGKDLNKIYYKSSRSLIYNGKPYYCEAAIENGTPLPSVGYSQPQELIDLSIFWKDSEKFIFLESD